MMAPALDAGNVVLFGGLVGSLAIFGDVWREAATVAVELGGAGAGAPLLGPRFGPRYSHAHLLVPR